MRGVYEACYQQLPVRAAGQHGGTVQPASALRRNGFKDHGLLGIDPETGEWVLYAADLVDYLNTVPRAATAPSCATAG